MCTIFVLYVAPGYIYCYDHCLNIIVSARVERLNSSKNVVPPMGTVNHPAKGGWMVLITKGSASPSEYVYITVVI